MNDLTLFVAQLCGDDPHTMTTDVSDILAQAEEATLIQLRTRFDQLDMATRLRLAALDLPTLLADEIQRRAI